MKKIFLGFLLAACQSGLSAQTVEIDKLPTITVTGIAEVRVVPDEAIFNLKVEKLNKDLNLAQKQNDETVAQIITLARQFGILPQNIKTDVYEYEEKFTWAGKDESKRLFLGFEVSKDVVIRLTDISKFEALFQALIKSGVSKVEDVNLQTTEIRRYKDQARSMAMKAAKEKATAMAGEIGQTIGKAIWIHEGSGPGGGRFTIGGSSGSSNSYASANTSTGGESYAAGYSANENSTFSVGTIVIKAEVTVGFILN